MLSHLPAAPPDRLRVRLPDPIDNRASPRPTDACSEDPMSRNAPRNHSPHIALALLLAAACSGGDTVVPEVPNPTPAIDALDPSEIQAGSPATTLVVTGSDFVPRSVIRINGTDRATTYTSDRQVSTQLSAAELATAGTLQVVVFNPAPGGGTSSVALLPVRPVQNPLPAITGLSPDPVTVSLSPVTVTVVGTGFVPSSVARINSSTRVTTYTSPTQLSLTLDSALVSRTGSYSITVSNPAPGGGVSSPRTLAIHSPVPTLTSLSANEIPAAQVTYPLRVTGTGFYSASQIAFSGAPRATKLIDAATLEGTLLEGDLKALGTFPITVVNPTPGGGTSNSLYITLVAPQPVIAMLPSRGAASGGSGFSLPVYGSGFLEGSVVLWNGQARTTQYLGSTRLLATVTPQDLADPRSVAVQVRNPGAGGKTSDAWTFTVRSVGAATVTSTRRVSLPAKDIVYSDATGRLYVSVTSTHLAHGNSLARIDPTTGAIEASVFVGSNPSRLGISGDGTVAYVGIDGANGVRRVDLPTMAAGTQWTLGDSEVAGDIEVVPGSQNAVVVSRHNFGLSPSLRGVTLYDDGVPRANSGAGHTGGSRIAFLEGPDTLYGFNNLHTGYDFFTIGVFFDGIRHLASKRGLISGFNVDIEGAGGRIYGTDGSVVDAQLQRKEGTMAGSIAMTVDPDAGRAYLVQNASIDVYDLNTFQRLGTIPVGGWTFDHPARIIHRLVRWGTDGLALVDLDEVFIIRSPIVAR